MKGGKVKTKMVQTGNLGLGIFLAVVGLIFMINSFRVSGKKVAGMPKGIVGTVFGVFLVIGLALVYNAGGLAFMGIGPLAAGAGAGNGLPDAGTGAGTGGENPLNTYSCTYQPTATYNALDLFTSAASGGTAYYKNGDQRASTIALTNVKPGRMIGYWVSNSTAYIAPTYTPATCDAQDVTAYVVQNGTATLTVYDTLNRATATGGAYNTSVAAAATANYELSYQGTAKKSFMPFGGVMILEYNNSIPSGNVIATGDDITLANDFHVTYSEQNGTATSTYKVYKVLPTIDVGTGGLPKKISVQFTAGSSLAAKGPWVVTFLPANYYYTNSGTFEVDVEKYLNGENTRVGLGTLSYKQHFG